MRRLQDEAEGSLTLCLVAEPEPHSPVPHPCAPDSIVSSSAFLSSLGSKPEGTGSHSGYGESSGQSSSSQTPLAGPAGGKAPGSGFESSLPEAKYDESNLPAWLSRSRYAPQEEELEAVLVRVCSCFWGQSLT